jgi:lipopolysaccharide assembly outer membrane protein LptD (OstA)
MNRQYRIIIILFCFHSLYSGELVNDSTLSNPDTIKFIAVADTAVSDSAITVKTSSSKLESSIYYWADKVNVSTLHNKIFLEGRAKIVYENMTLLADKITINQDSSSLFAEGIMDTVDSLGNPVYKSIPVFTEKGEEPIYGNNLEYNFKTKRGKVISGKTQMPPGFYKGEDIHKISKNTMLVRDGYFTSCEYIDHPHFYFRSDRMRVVVKDKIIAKPVYFYIADVPLFVIPFGVFPNKRGRHSGLIIPSYGESRYGGRFLKNLGYYWAPNDYFDATLNSDFYDQIGLNYRANLKYTVRYILSGSIEGKYLPKDLYTKAKHRRWAISADHSQQIDPSMKITARGTFQSDKYLERQYSSDFARRTNQTIYSSFNLSKNWKGTKNSMSLSASRNENLQNGNIEYTFPNVRFSRPSASLYTTIFGSELTSTKKWYQEIYFSYNSNLIHTGSKTLQADSSYLRTQTQNATHNLNFQASPKIFGYLSINPKFIYQELWVDKINIPVMSANNTIITEKKKQFAIRRTFSSSLSLSTNLYGLFEPHIGSLKYIRHKLSPNISFSYTPDFSSSFYGYFSEIADTTGRIHKIDKFKGTPSSESRSINISIDNLFQAKLIQGEEEKKIDLFTLNFSSGYNYKADSLKWGNLNTHFRSSLIKGISLDASTIHSFYQLGRKGKINKFVFNQGDLPKLLSFQAGTSFSLTNEMFKKKSQPDQESSAKKEMELVKGDSIANEGILELEEAEAQKLSDEYAAKNIDIPWRINFSLNYRYYRTNIMDSRKSIDLSSNASITLTKNWRISWNGRFDLITKEITYQSYSIYRDLHCWEMSFNWQPTIDYYSFQINIKTSMLKDIKVTKHPSGRAYYY